MRTVPPASPHPSQFPRVKPHQPLNNHPQFNGKFRRDWAVSRPKMAVKSKNMEGSDPIVWERSLPNS